MALAYLTGDGDSAAQQGDPINLKRRLAFQPRVDNLDGIPPAEANYVDFRMNGGPVPIEAQTYERLAISPGGEPLSPLTGKMQLGGGPFSLGDIDPANKGLIMMLMNAFGAYTYQADTPQAGARRWTIRPNGSSTPKPFLSMLEDNDVLPRHRIVDMRIGGYTVSAQPNSNLAIEMPFACSNHDFFGAVEQTVGSGSTVPICTRTWSGNWSADSDDNYDIWIYVAEDYGSSANIVVLIGASDAAYTASDFTGVEQSVTFGTVTRLYDENGSGPMNRVGTMAEQVRIFWPTTATIAAGDVFRVPRRRGDWTQSLGTERPISSVNTLFYLDSEEVRVEGGWNVTGAWGGIESHMDVGGRQGATVEKRGKHVVTVEPSRKLSDLTIQKAAHQGSTVSLVIDSYTDEAITGASPATPYRFLMVMPNLRPAGQMYSPEAGAENRDENWSLIAGKPTSTFTYDGLSFDDHVTIVIETDVQSSDLPGI